MESDQPREQLPAIRVEEPVKRYPGLPVRAALVPHVPHIAVWICLVVLAGALSALLAVGVRGFYRRAID